jgi:hypothetical protein
MIAMADDAPLKSAYELAMERLQKGDKDAGIERKPLTDAQRAAIAEVRNLYESKLAEQDVMHQSKLRRTLDVSEIDALNQLGRQERERLVNDRDAKIEQIRRGE